MRVVNRVARRSRWLRYRLQLRNLARAARASDQVRVAMRVMTQEFVAGRSRAHVIHQGVISGLTKTQAETQWRRLHATDRLVQFAPPRKKRGRR